MSSVSRFGLKNAAGTNPSSWTCRLEVSGIKRNVFRRQGAVGLRVLFSRCPVIWSASQRVFLAFFLAAGTLVLNVPFF
jgi:hypothetical protein